jgi:hypothetical protein
MSSKKEKAIAGAWNDLLQVNLEKVTELPVVPCCTQERKILGSP